MALGRPLSPLTLLPAERQQLLDWTRRPKTGQALALRAGIVLFNAAGYSNTEVAVECMSRWPQRASGGSVFSFCASMGCSMNPVPARRAA
jgi:hypothetical protein